MGSCTRPVVRGIDEAKFPDVDDQSDDNVVHLNGFRKTNGFAAQSFDVGT